MKFYETRGCSLIHKDTRRIFLQESIESGRDYFGIKIIFLMRNKKINVPKKEIKSPGAGG